MPGPLVRPLVLLTDFGLRDPYVGVMKGVIAGIAPDVPVIDLTHDVPPQDVLVGAIWLADSVEWFPAGTIFICVVDPGVGTDRRLVAAHIGPWTFVAPDNGLLSGVARSHPVERAVEITSRAHTLPRRSATFHGRDVLAPVAAWIARGVPVDDLGPVLAHLHDLELPGSHSASGVTWGTVLYADRFGNLVTSIPAAALARRGMTRLAGRTCPLVRTYGDACPGELVALVGSGGRLEIAVVNGNAAATLGVTPGERVEIREEEVR